MWATGNAARAAGDKVVETASFQGRSDWLVLFGVGAAVNDAARKKQLALGGRALLWDLGYIHRKKIVGNLRMSIDQDHPQDWLDKTPEDGGARWNKLNVELREDADKDGPIVLVGLGRKSRLYLDEQDWEARNYARLLQKFPGRRIVFRPKSVEDCATRLPCATDAQTPIAQLLKGKSLVVCRHSNVAVDAAIAGVPFEAENGAAVWLKRREFTYANRLEFLQRLAWWQWRATEAAQAWKFAKQVTTA